MLKFIPSNARRRMYGRVLAAALGTAALSACATSGASGTSGTASAAPSRGSRYLITEQDLANSKADNLYDAIQKLRPEFLRGDQNGIVGQTDPTGTPSGGSISLQHDAVVPVSVYRNNVRLDGVDDLKHMLPSEVKEVRFLKSTDAQIRLGTDNAAGAILVTTK